MKRYTARTEHARVVEVEGGAKQLLLPGTLARACLSQWGGRSEKGIVVGVPAPLLARMVDQLNSYLTIYGRVQQRRPT